MPKKVDAGQKQDEVLDKKSTKNQDHLKLDSNRSMSIDEPDDQAKLIDKKLVTKKTNKKKPQQSRNS